MDELNAEWVRYRDVVDEIAKVAVDGKLATLEELRGCTEQEVEGLEQRLGVRLPLAYRAFLARMGKGTGRFMRGSAFLCDDVPGITEAVRELAEDSPEYLIPLDAVGFWEHQGYQVLFFPSKSGDDPPVFHWIEDQPAKQVSERFTEWLRSAIQDQVGLEQELSSARRGRKRQ